MAELEKKVEEAKKVGVIDIGKLTIGGLLVYDVLKKKFLTQEEGKKQLMRRVAGGALLGAGYDQADKYGLFDSLKKALEPYKKK